MRFNFKLNIKEGKGGIKMFASLLSFLGSFTANVGSQGCSYLIVDEPKMPKSLIK